MKGVGNYKVGKIKGKNIHEEKEWGGGEGE